MKASRRTGQQAFSLRKIFLGPTIINPFDKQQAKDRPQE